MLNIVKANTRFQYEQARELFLEYVNSIDIDLSFQNIATELENIPGEYGPPEGCILLSYYENQLVGCVAVRKLEDLICEMKRLFVKSEFKGKGIGRALATAIISEAKSLGYDYMRLDTLSTMIPALTLYKSLGFYNIEPYCYNPIEEAEYLELKLNNNAQF